MTFTTDTEYTLSRTFPDSSWVVNEFDPLLFYKIESNQCWLGYNPYQDFGATLRSECYFSPAGVPHLSNVDLSKGSCFSGFNVVPPGHTVTIKENKIQFSYEPDLTLEQYISALKEQLVAEVSQLAGSKIVLGLSGGVDSLVVASLLLHCRVPFSSLTFKNNTPGAFVEDAVAVGKLADLQRYLQSIGVEVLPDLSVSDQDVIDAFNTSSYSDFLCYTTRKMTLACPDSKLVTGMTGNWLFIHYACFDYELGTPKGSPLVPTCPEFYTRQTKRTINSPINNQHFIKRSYKGCSFWDQLAFPGYNHECYSLLRRLDLATVDPMVNLDALVARALIQEFQPALLEFVHVENNNDSDSMLYPELPLSQLQIPVITPHPMASPEGDEWLQYQLRVCQDSGRDRIDMNTLTAFLARKQLIEAYGSY